MHLKFLHLGGTSLFCDVLKHWYAHKNKLLCCSNKRIRGTLVSFCLPGTHSLLKCSQGRGFCFLLSFFFAFSSDSEHPLNFFYYFPRNVWCLSLASLLFSHSKQRQPTIRATNRYRVLLVVAAPHASRDGQLYVCCVWCVCLFRGASTF